MGIDLRQIWLWSFRANRWSIWRQNGLHLYFLVKVSFFIYSVRWLWIVGANYCCVGIAWLGSYVLMKVYRHLTRSHLSHLRRHLWCRWRRHRYLICICWVFFTSGRCRSRWHRSSGLNISKLQILRVDLNTATFRIYLLKLRYSILIFAYMNFIHFRVVIIILLRIKLPLVPIPNMRLLMCISPLVNCWVLIRLAIIEHISGWNLDVLDAAGVYFYILRRDVVYYHLCPRVNVIRKS